jgi:hypothetical protein
VVSDELQFDAVLEQIEKEQARIAELEGLCPNGVSRKDAKFQSFKAERTFR